MEFQFITAGSPDIGRAVPRSKNYCFGNYDDYFEAMVGFTQPFFITPCDGRKLR